MIYISIFWYSKNCWLSVKKWWCQQRAQGVCHMTDMFYLPACLPTYLSIHLSIHLSICVCVCVCQKPLFHLTGRACIFMKSLSTVSRYFHYLLGKYFKSCCLSGIHNTNSGLKDKTKRYSGHMFLKVKSLKYQIK